MDRHADAARLLLSARRDPAQRLRSFPDVMRPADDAAAYLIQRAVAAGMGPIGGWKVGCSPATGVFTCAPLPRAGVRPSPAAIGPDCTDRGIEAEIAVTLAADLPPRATPYGEADLRAAIESAHPAIEVLHSRFADPGTVDKPSLLADGLGHHALVVGPAMPHWAGVDLRHETVRVLVAGPGQDGREVKAGTGNPGGDIMRLLAWLANTGAAWAGGLRAGQVVTTGSWTGADTVPAAGTAQVVFAHMGAAEVSFA